MNSEEARQIVQRGLDQRKADRQFREREGRLEQYELDMIKELNAHCDAAKRDMAYKQQEKARIAARQAAAMKAKAKEEAAKRAIRQYEWTCVGILFLVAWTHLPWWAALALAFGLGTVLLAYLFRLYCLSDRR